MGFMDESYLLESDVAKVLFNEIAGLPIVDAHNHGDIREIVKNEGWSDIWVVEGATDHYVWELMRKRGIPEKRITGTATNREKWNALAEVFPELIGNPVYEWTHLDLRRRFGITDIISSDTAEKIWEETREKLKHRELHPQALLKEMKVEVMCTTDDPTVSLPDHEKAKEEIAHTSIKPTWRPDKFMNIEMEGWQKRVESLGGETNVDISTLTGFIESLRATHDYFDRTGCVASDHGLEQPYAYYVSETRAAEIYQKRLNGNALSADDVADFHAFMLVLFGKMNAETKWVTQLHIGAVRDYRSSLLNDIGADSGGDISSQAVEYVKNLSYFFNEFDSDLKMVLYCVDPSHLPTLVTLSRAFPNISIGAPWWWNDSPYGMETHLKYVATVDLLSNHAGMVTDSRKLLSFGSRTEMFRRVLSNVLGEMVNKGKAPLDAARDLARSLAYFRPKSLFFGTN